MPPLRHVLLAEPDAEERLRIASLVRRAAAELEATIELHEAENGTDALRLIEAHRPPLVIAEVLLPNLSGLQLIRRLRDRSGAEELPRFIFVTTMGRESDRYWALRNGAHAYVIKPYEDELLFTRIRQVLASGSSAPAEKLGPL